MRRRGAELFLSYILNHRQQLENEITVLEQNIRYRKISTLDCLELIIASERLECFNEFAKNSLTLLGFDKNEQILNV